MGIDLKRYRVQPESQVRLDEIDPRDTGDYDGGKDEGKEELEALTGKLETLQEQLFAAHRHALLIVLQGMDTCGKDGTIRHVFEGVNPQGVRVAGFKAPSALELDHDYLWRVHQQTPAKGEMVIFNRSHYEDVLVVRVKGLAPEPVWRRRFDHINDFEHMLADEGTTILKFFLHISKEEQKERLLDRLKEPDKNWKFNPGDIQERERWNDYIKAYEEAISRTSTAWAPWYIIPADRKWFRNLVVAAILVETLEKLDPQPQTPFTREEIELYREQLK